MAAKKVMAYGKFRYRSRYRDVDSRSWKCKTFDTKDEAEDFEASLRLAKSGRVFVRKQSTQTLRQFWHEYLHEYALLDLQAATVEGHKQAWSKWIEPSLGMVPLATLASSPELVQRLKQVMVVSGAGEPTQRRVLAVLSAVLTKAVQLNRIANNPVRVIRKPPATRKHDVRAISPEAVEALLGKCKTIADRRLVALTAYAGLRPAESLALTKEDVAERTISVSKSLKLDGVGSTKTGGRRIVPIPDALRPYLADLPDGLLFPDQSGKHWSRAKHHNWRVKSWQPAAQAAGLGMITRTQDGKRSYTGARPYDLRHCAASTMLASGVDPVRVAQIMGHSPAVLFSTYAHVIAEVCEPVEGDGCTMAAQAASEGQSAQ